MKCFKRRRGNPGRRLRGRFASILLKSRFFEVDHISQGRRDATGKLSYPFGPESVPPVSDHANRLESVPIGVSDPRCAIAQFSAERFFRLFNGMQRADVARRCARAGQIEPPSRHRLGLASSGPNAFRIGRHAAQAFPVLFCMTREGAHSRRRNCVRTVDRKIIGDVLVSACHKQERASAGFEQLIGSAAEEQGIARSCGDSQNDQGVAGSVRLIEDCDIGPVRDLDLGA